MTIRKRKNDFDAPDELVAPAPYSSASTKPTGAIPLSVNKKHTLSDAIDSPKSAFRVRSAPARSEQIHNYNLNALRRVGGNPAVYDQEIENGRIV